MGKDISAIWGRKGIRALLMVLPVILIVIVPLVYFVAISLFPASPGSQIPAALRAILGNDRAGDSQFWMDAFTTLLCPLLFLMVPIVCSVASAACVFVGEKENSTLETLFLSSMSAKSVFSAKITACSLISVAISLIAFVLFSITISIVDLLLSAPYFFNLEWLVTVVVLMPVLSMFSVTFVSLVLSRVYSVGEALQTMGYLILPFLILYLVQFTGVFRITALFLIILSLVLALLSILLFNLSSRRFQSEYLAERPVEE